jgi:hypothetical protein
MYATRTLPAIVELQCSDQREQKKGLIRSKYIQARAHHLMQLCLCEVGDERLDQHRRFTLTNERRSGRDYSLRARDSQRPEEEYGEFAD